MNDDYNEAMLDMSLQIVKMIEIVLVLAEKVDNIETALGLNRCDEDPDGVSRLN